MIQRPLEPEVLVPSGLICLPTNPFSFFAPAGACVEQDCFVDLPLSISPGFYELFSRVGANPPAVLLEDSIEVTVTP